LALEPAIQEDFDVRMKAASAEQSRREQLHREAWKFHPTISGGHIKFTWDE
jgi:hypothetical protein